MKNIFKKKSKSGVTSRPIIGITDAEYLRIHDALVSALDEARNRQKSADAKPSGYMKGLREAINIVERFAPHIM